MVIFQNCCFDRLPVTDRRATFNGIFIDDGSRVSTSDAISCKNLTKYVTARIHLIRCRPKCSLTLSAGHGRSNQTCEKERERAHYNRHWLIHTFEFDRPMTSEHTLADNKLGVQESLRSDTRRCYRIDAAGQIDRGNINLPYTKL